MVEHADHRLVRIVDPLLRSPPGNRPVLEARRGADAVDFQKIFHVFGRKLISDVPMEIAVRRVGRIPVFGIPDLPGRGEVATEYGQSRGGFDGREGPLPGNGVREHEAVGIHYRIRKIVGTEVLVHPGKPSEFRQPKPLRIPAEGGPVDG